MRLFIKSQVKAHPRKLKSGKIVQVKEYSDKRTKKTTVTPPQPPLLLSIAPEDAADLIVNNDDLDLWLDVYVSDGWEQAELNVPGGGERIAEIVKRVYPRWYGATLYRGTDSYFDDWAEDERPIRSFSFSRDVARNMGDRIEEKSEPTKYLTLEDIAMARMRRDPDTSHYAGMQSEALVVKSLFAEEDHPRRPAGDPHGGQFIHIPMAHVEANPDQPRKTFAPQEPEELAGSIRENGVMQAIVVRPHPRDVNRYQIVAGERRFRASQLADQTHIPAIVRDLTDKQVATMAMIENVNRADMNGMEEAEGYANLQRLHGWDVEELAKQTGKNPGTLLNKLALNNLHPLAKEMVRRKTLKEGYAVAMSSLSHERQLDVMAQMGRKPMSLQEVRALCSVLESQEKQNNLFGIGGSEDDFELQREAEHKKYAKVKKATLDKYRQAMSAGAKIWKNLLHEQSYKVLPAALEGNVAAERRKVQGMIKVLQAIDKELAKGEAYKQTHGSMVGYIEGAGATKIDKKIERESKNRSRGAKKAAKARKKVVKKSLAQWMETLYSGR